MSTLSFPSDQDLFGYDHYIVAFSGGKDSVACFLALLEAGVNRDRIELWHHHIDGKEGSRLMDWPITPAYCEAFAAAFDVPIYASWKVGGFEREMLRENALTAPTKFEEPTENGRIIRQVGGVRGKKNTRRRWPAISASLSSRWCSAYLKIDVGSTALRNQKRFANSRTLFITGERAEESPARSKYNTFEPDRTDNRNGRTGRHVDHWRTVHHWKESDVWAIIERWNVNPHPAYILGWGRVSCRACIFGSPNQWASLQCVDPSGIQVIANYEDDFHFTVHRTQRVLERATAGTAYASITTDMAQIAMSTTYNEPIIVDQWQQPAGAYGESCGPT